MKKPPIGGGKEKIYMNSSREEFEKLSEADQKWVTEVMRLLGELDSGTQKKFIALAEMLDASNEPQHVKA